MSKENANPIIHVKSSSQRTSLKKVDPRFFCARDKSVLMALADSNQNDDFIADLFGIDIEMKSKAGQVQQRLELELGPPKIFSMPMVGLMVLTVVGGILGAFVPVLSGTVEGGLVVLFQNQL